MARTARSSQGVNEPQTDAEVERLRESIQGGRPFGEAPWQQRTAAELAIESSLRPRGRPRKDAGEQDAGLFN
jgi:putative transposase